MISLKTSPYLLVACCVFTFVVIFSLSSDKSAGRWSMPRTSSAAANLKKPNYIGASDSLLPRDTTSEIGRASNSSLGVCCVLCALSYFPSLPISPIPKIFITTPQSHG